MSDFQLYAGIIIVGALMIAFTIFGLTMLGCCTYSHTLPRVPAGSIIVEEKPSTAFISLDSLPILSFQYKKARGSEEEGSTNQTECIICMMAFEEEESVRQLTNCKHIFHAPCIDQWLYSYSGCPLCRSYIDKMASPSGIAASDESSHMLLVIVGS